MTSEQLEELVAAAMRKAELAAPTAAKPVLCGTLCTVDDLPVLSC